MKMFMTMVSAIMMVAAANAETKNVAPFNEVKVNVPARIRVIQGNDYGISVRAKDNADAATIQYRVENGVLRISSYDLEALNANTNKLMITVITPSLAPNVTAGRDVLITEQTSNDATGDVASL